MINLDAPIVPGTSAAGIAIGFPADSVASLQDLESREQLDACERFDFKHVRVWTRDSKVSQVCVVLGYRGRTDKGIGVGSKLQEVLNAYGEVTEDDDDNLIVPACTGWCFDTEVWYKGPDVSQNVDGKIESICVFKAS